MSTFSKIRNICIIAHVDHGKTTLVDFLLRQAGTFQKHQAVEDRVMDSMDLERERGITILAKNTSVKVGDVKINIVDTPGHADFGGEVERIMGMVDGALLLIDAAEGPLPQTRFVLQKALAQGLKVILVINKVDRPDARVKEVVNQAFDLFIDLGATEEQAHFPIVYACARSGWCTLDFDEIEAYLQGKQGSLQPLFDEILRDIPGPSVLGTEGLQMSVLNLSYSEYVGRLAIGKVLRGGIKKSQRVTRRGLDESGNLKNESFQVTQLYTYDGLKQVECTDIKAGDIGVVAGSAFVEIGDTLVSSDEPALPRVLVEKPTLGMIFSVNTSPLSGKEGEAIQSRKLRDRLLKEVRKNVALRLEDTDSSDQFRVLGRGELQFAILIEQMRREGFEFMVGKPTVLYHKNEAGERLEPLERAVLDLPETAVGSVTQLFQSRKGILTKYERSSIQGNDRVRLEFDIPTRGLLGIRSWYLTITKGDGLISTLFLEYVPHKGELVHRSGGALVSDRLGDTVEYGLLGLEDRGVLFLSPGCPVYEGMIIGEHNKENDLNVNPCKEKKLTNIRAAHAEVLVTLASTKKLSLEQCIEWIDEDEWIEITPKSVRLRKKVLSQNLRSVKRQERIL